MKGAPYDNNNGNDATPPPIRTQPAQTESQLNPHKVNFLRKEVNLFSKRPSHNRYTLQRYSYFQHQSHLKFYFIFILI